VVILNETSIAAAMSVARSFLEGSASSPWPRLKGICFEPGWIGNSIAGSPAPAKPGDFLKPRQTAALGQAPWRYFPSLQIGSAEQAISAQCHFA